MDNKKHKGCTPFSVSVVFAIVIICYKMCEPPPPPFVTDPDSIRAESKRYLEQNRTQFNRAIEKIKSYNIQHPIRFTHLGRGGGDMIIGYYNNGHYKNITNQYLELRDYLLHSCHFNRVEIYSDSVLTRFYAFSGLVDRVVHSLYYTDKNDTVLREYRYGARVFSKDEIPNTKRAYFWEIEDNWYVYSPKVLYDTDTVTDWKLCKQWAMANKECLFMQKSDTLEMIVKELNRLSLQDDSRIWETEGTEGYWRIINDMEDDFFCTKTTLLDSLFADNCYPMFKFEYTHKYIQVNIISNDYLKYYYTELPQDSLECLIKKKVFILKDNWYYEDF